MRNDGLKCHKRYFVNRKLSIFNHETSRVARKQPLLHMQTTKVQASLRIRVISPEPLLFTHIICESRETFSPRINVPNPLSIETLKLRTVRVPLFLRHGTILLTYYMYIDPRWSIMFFFATDAARCILMI